MYAASVKQMEKPCVQMSGSNANGVCREFIIGSQRRSRQRESQLLGSSASNLAMSRQQSILAAQGLSGKNTRRLVGTGGQT